MSRYINPLTDFGFKKLFGSEPNKELLIAFLNALLPPHHHIADLQFIKNEHLAANPLDRRAIFDLYCQSSTGERFIVEVQQTFQEYFKDRSIYYSTFALQEQAMKGQWNFELRVVYTIGILDFIFSEHDEVVHTAQLKDQQDRVFFDKLTYIYLELPKFTKEAHELGDDFEKWLYLLRHLATLEKQPSDITGDIYDRLFEAAELPSMGSDERRAYEDSLKAYRDFRNTITFSYDRGRKKGKEEGRQEGEQTERLWLAAQFLREGVPIAIIQSATELSKEEIEQLRS